MYSDFHSGFYLNSIPYLPNITTSHRNVLCRLPIDLCSGILESFLFLYTRLLPLHVYITFSSKSELRDSGGPAVVALVVILLALMKCR